MAAELAGKCTAKLKCEAKLKQERKAKSAENHTDELAENSTDELAENRTDKLAENRTDKLAENRTDKLAENRTAESSSSSSCHIVNYLPAVNALLHKLNAEVNEVTPGRLSLCQATGVGNRMEDFKDVPAEQAAIFLGSLLKNHCCIEAVEFKPHLRHNSALVICNALCAKCHLTCLRVHHAFLSDGASLSVFVAVRELLIGGLRELSLEKLSISLPPDPGLEEFLIALREHRVQAPIKEKIPWPPLEGFEEALANTRTLTTLTLLNIRERVPATRNVLTMALTGLLTNESITSLKVDTSYLDGAEALRKFLATTTTLAELHVYCSSEGDPASTDLLFNALERNSSVKKLTLRKFAKKDLESFAELLDVNKHLEDVCFYACPRTEMMDGDLKTLDTYQGPEGCMNAVIKALKRGTSLRRLTLDWPCTPHMIYCLLEASESSPSLRELHLGDVIVDDPEFLHGVFVHARAGIKVTAARCTSSNGTINKLIPLWEPKDTANFVNCLYSVNLRDVGRALSSHDGGYVTSLSVGVNGDSSSIAVHALSLYLTSTPELRELQLWLGAISRDLQQVLLSSFQQNVSLERLSIYGSEDLCIPEDIQNTLFTWMANSKRLYTINVELHKFETTTLLGILAASERQNYVLTSLTFKQCWADESVLETNFRMVSRNRQLLRFAAAFVHGEADERARCAYNIIRWHPQLPEVVQNMGCSDRAAAERMILEAAERPQTDEAHLVQLDPEKQQEAHLVCLDPEKQQEAHLVRLDPEKQ